MLTVFIQASFSKCVEAEIYADFLRVGSPIFGAWRYLAIVPLPLGAAGFLSLASVDTKVNTADDPVRTTFDAENGGLGLFA